MVSVIQRDQKIDVVRCLMNYMVVLLHAWAAFQYVDTTTLEFKSWTFVLSHLCWIAIPTFFVISGYLFFANFSLADLGNKLMRRIRRLLVPYLIWNVTFVLFYLLMARIVPRLATRVATFGLGTFSGAMSKIVSLSVAPIDGPLWFLRVLILLALFSPFLFVLMRIWKGWFLLMLSALWMIMEPYLGVRASLYLTFPSYALTCYAIGGVLAMNGINLIRFFRFGGWAVLGLIACVIRWMLNVTALSKWGVAGFDNVLSVLEAPVLLSLVNYLPVGRLVSNCGYTFLRNMAFFAYAGHFLFCSMYLHTFAPLLSFMATGKFTVLILVFFCCGVTTMAGIFAFGRRFCPSALKLWDGTL